uniref:hypothetical protein n=1 Tax=Candidatus Scatousia sp. TaxID=3085663 RepID=UPI0015AEBE88
MRLKMDDCPVLGLFGCPAPVTRSGGNPPAARFGAMDVTSFGLCPHSTENPQFQEYGAICKLRGIPCAKYKNCYRKRLKRCRNTLRKGK